MSFSCTLTALLFDLLTTHHDGLSEYQLIRLLQQQAVPDFVDSNLSDPLSLFRSHFILFNALYRLDDALVKQGLQLEISPLCIRLQPRAPQQAGLKSHNALRTYYLDMRHLDATGREQVTALLDGSLQRLQNGPAINSALTLLGLETHQTTPTAAQIRAAYRRKLSRHHPDRGGCTQRMQQLNQALSLLRQHGLL